MATIKSFTDISQSKTLRKILAIESADMYYIAKPDSTNSNMIPSDMCIPREIYLDGQADGELCAWSFAALLDILPDKTCIYKKTYKDGRVKYKGIAEGIKELILKDNPIDACVAMIIRLNELNLL